MNTPTKNIFRIFTLVATTVAATSLLSCRDDDMADSRVHDNRVISFSLDKTEGFGKLTRTVIPDISGEDNRTITLVSDKQEKLYLSVEEDESLETKGETRGSLVTSSDIDSFGVFAQLEDVGSLYMSNVKVTESAAVWMPEKEYLWPGNEKLHFNAYSPYIGSSADEGITSVPEPDENGVISLGFTTPKEVTSQFDLLRAVPIDADSSPCAMTFSHALTAVRFATGNEMSPCVIKGISISGVADKGILNLESGEWSGLSGSSTFSVSPDLTLSAAQGSSYVLPETLLADENETMLLIPQTLGENTEVSLVVEANGEISTFKASLSGQNWTAGKTVTYHLSVSPEDSGLILEAVDDDGNRISSISSEYYGGEHYYNIISRYTDSKTSTEQPVEWEAAVVDSEGNEIEIPDWIVSFDKSGTGDAGCILKTAMPAPKFLSTNAHTLKLRDAADVNSSSGQTRFNLASATGGDNDENTANCYIINAPGKYRFPLVYGNAIQNGVANTTAYVSSLKPSVSHNKTTLYNFINHLGNSITDPYIYNNSDCKPAGAELVWADGADIIRNVALSSDGKYIEFDVPASSIRQGNALVALKDDQGTVMWSWQLWISDVTTAGNMVEIPNPEYSNVAYDLLSCNLGHIYGGDVTEFNPGKAVIRITQKNVPEGETPLSFDLEVSQESATFTTVDNHPSYQWGRKDPLFGGASQYFDAENKMIDASGIKTAAFNTDCQKQIVNSILLPTTFFTGDETYLGGINSFYRNLWDINLVNASGSASNPQNIKTIYDPCPIGSKVPIGNSFIILSKYTASQGESSNIREITIPSTSETLDFTSLGYRQSDNGKLTNVENTTNNTGPCSIWSATAGGKSGVGHYLVIHNSGKITMETFVVTLGYGVRPAKD